eukprot:296879-Rhodomonas_salina.1
MQQVAVHKALLAWMIKSKEERRLRLVAGKVVSRWLQMSTARAWEAWHEAILGRVSRMESAR